LWSFLLNLKEYSPEYSPGTNIVSNDDSPGYMRGVFKKIAGLDYIRDISPPAKSPIADMHIISNMADIPTDVGRARAWVRLAVEKRVWVKILKL
jgi:hypothetical protein